MALQKRWRNVTENKIRWADVMTIDHETLFNRRYIAVLRDHKHGVIVGSH